MFTPFQTRQSFYVMKELIIPDLNCNIPETGRSRPDKLLFPSGNNSCGGDDYCSGRRIIENSCNALKDQKGIRGLDSTCVVTIIKVQLEALNDYLGIPKNSPDKQRMRVEDVEYIIDTVRDENQMCIDAGEEELRMDEAFGLVTDLLLETLYANKTTSKHFFGITIDEAETRSFKDLDPKMLEKLRAVLIESKKLLYPADL